MPKAPAQESWQPYVTEAAVRSGDVMFRGESRDDPSDLPRFRPGQPVLWASNREDGALFYAKGYDGYPFMMEFEVEKTPRLVKLYDFRELDDLARWLGADEWGGDPRDLAPLVCDAGFDGWHIVNGEGGGSDTVFCKPDEFLALIEVRPLFETEDEEDDEDEDALMANAGDGEITAEIRVVADKLLIVGQAIFGRRVVHDCFAWFERGILHFAWLCDPLKMVTAMGVGGSDEHLYSSSFSRALKQAFGLRETDFDYEQRVSVHDIIWKIANALLGVTEAAQAADEIQFTLIPEPGWPWPTDGDVYYSAKARKLVPARKPGWLITIPADPSRGEGERHGINLCDLFGDSKVDGRLPRLAEAGLEDAVVAHFPGEDVIVTHALGGAWSRATGLGPAATGWDAKTWRENGESVRRCGGLLFASLAVGPVPATNFGTCVLIARVGLALEGVKPYRGRGAVRTWIYDTDAWTGRVGDANKDWAVAAFEQMHGHSDYLYKLDNHVWPLGAPGGMQISGGPAEATPILNTKKLNTELKRRFKRWRRDLTVAQIEKLQDEAALTTARYAYLEAKTNGVTPMSAFPVAVCPKQREREFRVFLDAAGWDGDLIVLDVPEDIIRTIEDDEWLHKQIAPGPDRMKRSDALQAWAALQYGWHIADVLRKRGPTVHVDV